MADKKSFVLYLDNEKQVNMLTDEQAGKLFKALFRFAKTGEETDFDDLGLQMIFSFMADSIKRDTEKYEMICKKRSENIKKRWNKSKQNNTKDTNEYNCNFCNTNDTDNDNVNDNDNDIDNENDKNIYIVSEIVSYLNSKAGTSYRNQSKDTQKHIHARLSEGYTAENFRTVIDFKCSEWLNDEKMRQYLRPSTLFGTKFESYLNSAKQKGVNENGTDKKRYTSIVIE